MTAGTTPLWLATALYCWQAANFWTADERGMALAFIGYAFANIGFILATRGV